MLNDRTIKSGDHCINIQVSDISMPHGLTKEALAEFQVALVQGVLNQLKKEQQGNELSSGISDPTQLFMCPEVGPVLEPKALVALLEEWSPNNSFLQRADALRKLFSSGVPLILKNPELAFHIKESVTCNNLLNKIVSPACKISLGHVLTLQDLGEFVEALGNDDVSHDNILSVQQQIYFIKVIFNILYQDNFKDENCSICIYLDNIKFNNNEILWQFYVDAFFRINCNYLFTKQYLVKYINNIACEYFIYNNTNPLTYLKRIILFPIEIYESYEFEIIIGDLKKIASSCKNIIEARWVVSALYRILPLYKTEDLDIDYDYAIDRVIGGFKPDLLEKFSFLKYSILKNSLYKFYMTGKISYLIRYENEFIETYSSLNLDQQLLLQIEYCSSIYLLLLNNNIDSMIGSKFYNFIIAKEQHLIEKHLFSNIIVVNDDRLLLSPMYDKKGYILKWLYYYIDRIFKMYAEKKLEQNPFTLVQYRATSKMPMLKPKINNIVSTFVNNITDESIASNPQYACKVISLVEFSRIARQIDSIKLMEFVYISLNSTKYDILINAKSISYILYHSKFYCIDIKQDDIAIAVNKFKESAFSLSLAPRLYFAETECINLYLNEKDKEFITALHYEFERTNRKLYQLSLKKGEEFNLVIPDRCIDVFKYYLEGGSILAMTGLNYLMVTEYWNLLATTVFNIQFPNKFRSLEISSIFYSIAKCFAREQRNIDQKYSFNYIKVQSLYYEMSKKIPSEFFFRDCSFYIYKQNNQYFSYKEECCEPFYRLIKQYYSVLPSDIRDIYSNMILPQRNWVKKVFERMEIGIFPEVIQIK